MKECKETKTEFAIVLIVFETDYNVYIGNMERREGLLYGIWIFGNVHYFLKGQNKYPISIKFGLHIVFIQIISILF